MGTIVIGSSANRKGITVNPSEVFFNGNVVNAIMSGVAEIWSSAKPLVPTMTSSTTPYGEVAWSSDQGSNYQGWKVFDGNENTGWATNGATNQWVYYNFKIPTRVTSFDIHVIGNSGGLGLKTYIIQGSNDKNTWTDLHRETLENSTSSVMISRKVNNKDYYTYYRLYAVDSYRSSGTPEVYIVSLQFYGKQLVGLVPTMTSNTTPYGEASVSKSTNSNYMAYHAFDGNDTSTWECHIGDFNTSGVGEYIQYKFPTSVAVKHIYMYSIGGNGVVNCNWRLEGSNDGETFYKIQDILQVAGATKQYLSINNNTKYMYYRLICKSATGNITTNDTRYIIFQTLQFYADSPLYKPLIPVMTSNTTPRGVVSASSVYGNGFEAWNAFDNSLSTAFLTASNTKTSDYYLQYDFGKTVCVKRAELLASTDKQTYNVKIQASNNGTTWDDVSDGVDIITTGGFSTAKSVDVDMSTNENYYRYYRAVMNSDKCSTQYSCVEGSYSFQIVKLQLYK